MPAKVRMIAMLDPAATGNFLGVVPINRGEGGWMIGRSDDDVSPGDTYLYRHDAQGDETGEVLQIQGTGHMTGFAFKNEKIWISFGNAIYTIPWQTGVVTSAAGTQLTGFPGGQVSLSPTLGYAVVRTRTSQYSYFRKYRADDLENPNAVPTQIGETIQYRRGGRRNPEQSFGLVNNSLFAGFGATNKRNYIEQYSFDTGKLVPGVPELDVTNFGKSIVPGKWEIEFAPGNLVLQKRGSGAKRRLIIGKHNLKTSV